MIDLAKRLVPPFLDALVGQFPDILNLKRLIFDICVYRIGHKTSDSLSTHFLQSLNFTIIRYYFLQQTLYTISTGKINITSFTTSS
jgi:hypothetical protein